MRTHLRTARIPAGSAERNLLGIELEAAGQTDKAIDCYQSNVRDGFSGNHPYDRLAVIFRRRKDTASEVAVLKRAIDVFSQLQPESRSDLAPKLAKFKQRLDRVYVRSKQQSTKPGNATVE